MKHFGRLHCSRILLGLNVRDKMSEPAGIMCEETRIETSFKSPCNTGLEEFLFRIAIPRLIHHLPLCCSKDRGLFATGPLKIFVSTSLWNSLIIAILFHPEDRFAIHLLTALCGPRVMLVHNNHHTIPIHTTRLTTSYYCSLAFVVDVVVVVVSV